MKIESTPREDNQVQLSVEFDPGTLETYKQRAARDLARQIKIPGFRPGKAPYNVIVRQIGEVRLTEEALELLVDERYPKIIEESGIHPFTAGQLGKIGGYDPLVLEFIVPLEPEVKLGDYRSIRRPYEPKTIEDSDVDEVLENLRDRQALLEPADRPAGEGDVVTVVLKGMRNNNNEPDGSESQVEVLVDERSYQILVHSADKVLDDEWPFPGFSQSLIGLSIGDERDLQYQFSDDFQFESLRGTDASYHFLVEDIKSRSLPELNDDFAKTVGDFDTLEALKGEILTSLKEQSLTDYDKAYDDAILEELVKQSTIKYPPQMLESEQNNVVDSFKRRLEQQGSTVELYLKTRDMDIEALKEEAKPVAEERLKRSLALLELANAEKIQVSEEELQNETKRTLNSLNQNLEGADARRLTDQRVMNNLVGNVMLDLLAQRAERRLHEIANGSYTPSEIDTGTITEDTIEIEESHGSAVEELVNNIEPDNGETQESKPAATKLEETIKVIEIEQVENKE